MTVESTPFQHGTVLWYWYEYYIVLLGFFAAAYIWALSTFRRPWTKIGILVKLALIATMASAMPLALGRLGVGSQEVAPGLAGVLSLAGVGLSLATGLPYLYFAGRMSDPELARPLNQHFNAADAVLQHLVDKLKPNISWGEQRAATALVLSELPPSVHAIRRTRPESRMGRVARRNFVKGARRALAVARLVEERFDELAHKTSDHATLEATTSEPRGEIAGQAQGELAKAMNSLAQVRGFLERFPATPRRAAR